MFFVMYLLRIVCMYRFNSGNSSHKKKSKKAQQTDGQTDKSKLHLQTTS